MRGSLQLRHSFRPCCGPAVDAGGATLGLTLQSRPRRGRPFAVVGFQARLVRRRVENCNSQPGRAGEVSGSHDPFLRRPPAVTADPPPAADLLARLGGGGSWGRIGPGAGVDRPTGPLLRQVQHSRLYTCGRAFRAYSEAFSTSYCHKRLWLSRSFVFRRWRAIFCPVEAPAGEAGGGASARKGAWIALRQSAAGAGRRP